MAIASSKLVKAAILIGIVASLTSGCSRTQSRSDRPSGLLLIAAAASLQPALTEINSLHKRSGTAWQVNYNFGASGALQRQIEQGAPIDVFISAAPQQMQALQQQQLLLPTTQTNLVTNRLVLITPQHPAHKLTNLRQLIEPEIQRIAIGEPRSVPVGTYATEAFTSLGILPQLTAKFVFGNNVRAVRSSVETGDADAGIVYSSDAIAATKVVIAANIPARLHSPIVYPIAIIKSSKNPAAAREYLNFLQTQPVQLVFKKYGFGIAN